MARFLSRDRRRSFSTEGQLKTKQHCFIITSIGCAFQVLFTYIRMGINLKNENYKRNHYISIICMKIKCPMNIEEL